MIGIVGAVLVIALALLPVLVTWRRDVRAMRGERAYFLARHYDVPPVSNVRRVPRAPYYDQDRDA